MKKHYSPVKDYRKTKNQKLLYRFIKAIASPFFPKCEFIWEGEKPKDNEPLFLVGNHTKIFAPSAFLSQYPKEIRTWSNSHFLYFKKVWRHMFDVVLKRTKVKVISYPLAVLIMPLIVALYRSIEPIPVYKQSKRIMDTIEKSVETYEEGIDQIVFPEGTENKVNPYIYKLQSGFTVVAKTLYERTGKLLKFYPTYVCQALKKILIGKPIRYDPSIPMRHQRNIIATYLEESIARLGDSLPPHKIYDIC